jgi:NADH-quinone oxidoreductase subunit M
MHFPILSVITFLPVVGVLVALAVPSKAVRWVTGAVMLADLALVGQLCAQFDVTKSGMQFVERADWIPNLHIQYFMGVDGISLSMLLLSVLLSFASMLASWNTEKHPKMWFVLLLLLEAAMNGVFLALDFVLFYVFWELVLVPMYFMIGQWGGPRRLYAAVKFFLYTLFGSVFMLTGIATLFVKTGTFDIVRLGTLGALLPQHMQYWLFGAFFLGFAVKVPVWPFHTWLPDAHVEAPTAASAILAGVLLKMGTYGFLRVSLPILPKGFQDWRMILGVLAVISIVYGAAVALAQTDVKKLVAYSSVSHMGFAMLGIAAGTAVGINGAVAVGFSHGLISGMLFLMVGQIYDRTHTRDMNKLSGAAGKMPVIGGLLAFAAIASVGLPGLSGFMGEFIALIGAWQSPLPHWLVLTAALGVLFGTVYMMWMVHRIILGKPSEAIAKCSDATVREVVVVAPLVVGIVALGLNWGLLLRFTDSAVQALAKALGA